MKVRRDLQQTVTYNHIGNQDNGNNCNEMTTETLNITRQVVDNTTIDGRKLNEMNVQNNSSSPSSTSSCCGGPGHGSGGGGGGGHPQQQNQTSISMNNSNGGSLYGNANTTTSCARTIAVDGSSGLSNIIYTSAVEANICTCPPGTCQKDGTCCSSCPSGSMCETCESPPSSSSSSNSSVSSLTSISSPGSPANVPGISYMTHHSISMSCSPSLSSFVSPRYVTAQTISH